MKKKTTVHQGSFFVCFLFSEFYLFIIQQILITYLFYTCYCIYVSPNSDLTLLLHGQSPGYSSPLLPFGPSCLIHLALLIYLVSFLCYEATLSC